LTLALRGFDLHLPSGRATATDLMPLRGDWPTPALREGNDDEFRPVERRIGGSRRPSDR
jgi:hypothetical protein